MVAGKQQKRPAQVHELPPTAAAVALAALRDAPMPQIDHPLFRASLEAHREFLEKDEKKHNVVISSSPPAQAPAPAPAPVLLVMVVMVMVVLVLVLVLRWWLVVVVTRFID